MKHFPLALATAALALGGLGGITAAQAGGDPTVGKQVLDALCVDRKGAPVFTPYAIGRCQAARATDEFAIERLVCEGLLDGSLTSGTTIGRPHRANWACIPGQSPG